MSVSQGGYDSGDGSTFSSLLYTRCFRMVCFTPRSERSGGSRTSDTSPTNRVDTVCPSLCGSEAPRTILCFLFFMLLRH